MVATDDGSESRLHVAVGVIEDDAGRVLVARRPPDSHQGDRWEFPGGKVEPGENVEQALARELWEEVGLEVAAAEPLIRIPHDYSSQSVLLDVHCVRPVVTRAFGRQGQTLRWAEPAELPSLRFPEANRGIVTAALLPRTYSISPDTDDPDDAAWWHGLDAALDAGYRLFQYRVPSLAGSPRHAGAAVARIQSMGGRCLINGDWELAQRVGADGVHLPAAMVDALPHQPLGWLAASCHDPNELAVAVAAGVDFAVLGPVAPTASHPDRPPLGWERFQSWVAERPVPIYALGGLASGDAGFARCAGGQGAAGITDFWPSGSQGAKAPDPGG